MYSKISSLKARLSKIASDDISSVISQIETFKTEKSSLSVVKKWIQSLPTNLKSNLKIGAYLAMHFPATLTLMSEEVQNNLFIAFLIIKNNSLKSFKFVGDEIKNSYTTIRGFLKIIDYDRTIKKTPKFIDEILDVVAPAVKERISNEIKSQGQRNYLFDLNPEMKVIDLEVQDEIHYQRNIIRGL
jgi:hypothetical protein